ncbi:MAG TPA: 2Fe-2S iron-sulfur cluster-binding protein [Usitatibacter sp.]|nr:2Fe-2S iron-sulfur cluster-binding protein [Usitatibacter sp.]
MTMDVELEVNGRPQRHAVEPRTSLADLLRGACELTGTHLGCEHGVCGACTVVVDGAPMRSCITYAVQAEGCAVQTIEGFDDDPLMAELREAFTRHHALQCGFCTPGMLITARDIVTRLPGADEARIREELGGNLCRCTGYVGIVRAVLEVGARVRVAAVERPVAADVAAAPLAMPEAQPAGRVQAPSPDTTTIAESVSFEHPAEAVWRVLADLERVARCLPGAQITSIEGERVKGRLRIRFGPIASSFDIEGVSSRDEVEREGEVSGQGRDSLTGSRARGRIAFAVLEAGSPGRCRLDVRLGFSIQGMLAQFSRGALVQDLARQLIAQFAENLSAELEGRAAVSAGPAEMNSLALLWGSLRRLLGRLFR